MSIYASLSTLEVRTARNIYFVGSSQVIALVLNVGTIAILSRVLTPEDFGIVGIGMIFLTLFYNLQDFGVIPAVVQREDRINESIAVGLTLRWVITGVISATVILLSQTISAFFGDASIAPVLVVYTLNLFILTLGFPSQVLLTRSLKFWYISIATILQSLSLCVVSISLAFAGWSYWSIVFGSIVGSSVFVIALRHFDRSRFKLGWDAKLAKELMGFGKHLLIVGIMVFVIYSVDQMVVARLLGVTVLGFYVIAIRFGRTVGEQISATVNRVLFPTMARIKDDSERIMTGYRQSVRMIAVIAVPVCLLMSALAPLFTQVVLGSVWSEAALPLAIISVQGLLNSLVAPAANVLVSIGKPKYMTVQSVAMAVGLLVGIYPVSVYGGLVGVCYLTTALSFGVFVYFLLVFSSIFAVRLRDVARPLTLPISSGLLTYLVLILSAMALPSNVVVLGALSLAGLGLYAALLHLLSKGRDLRDLLDLIRRSIRDG